VLYIRVRIYYTLARNLVLLAILISIWLVSAILYSRYNRYNSRYATTIKDYVGRTFLYTLRPLMALIILWLELISGSISGRPLIRVFPQLGVGGAVDIREYPAGGWLNT
jgi:hypothetical protein